MNDRRRVRACSELHIETRESLPFRLAQAVAQQRKRDLSRDRESSEQFVWYGETEMQLRRWAIRLSIEANRHQDEGI
jgi:hypothetical protein